MKSRSFGSTGIFLVQRSPRSRRRTGKGTTMAFVIGVLLLVAILAVGMASTGCRSPEEAMAYEGLPSASETPADEEWQQEHGCTNCTLAEQWKTEFFLQCSRDVVQNGPQTSAGAQAECNSQMKTLAWLQPGWRE